MGFDIKLPNISAGSDHGKIEQIHSYLYQLAEQLKFALNTIENSTPTVLKSSSQSSSPIEVEKEAQTTFNSIKALIISSAEIVEQYSEEFNKRFSGQYVAQSDFGTYKEATSNTISANSKQIESVFTSIQEITPSVKDIEEYYANVKGHIIAGEIDTKEGVPIYGLEIGQQMEDKDGNMIFNKFARFTSDRLSFYDQNDTEVAYISDFILHITNAEITGTLTLGRFVFDTSDGLAIKWV